MLFRWKRNDCFHLQSSLKVSGNIFNIWEDNLSNSNDSKKDVCTWMKRYGGFASNKKKKILKWLYFQITTKFGKTVKNNYYFHLFRPISLRRHQFKHYSKKISCSELKHSIFAIVWENMIKKRKKGGLTNAASISIKTGPNKYS